MSQIVFGNKTLELRPASVDKATAARAILKDLRHDKEVDFLLCIGDGKTDEPMFSYVADVHPSAVTCAIGKKQTEAKCYTDSVKGVLNMLEMINSA
jgi:trehalose 6-phosphate synthase/phosphatase